METMQFYITKVTLFLGTIFLCIQVVLIIDIHKKMKIVFNIDIDYPLVMITLWDYGILVVNLWFFSHF